MCEHITLIYLCQHKASTYTCECRALTYWYKGRCSQETCIVIVQSKSWDDFFEEGAGLYYFSEREFDLSFCTDENPGCLGYWEFYSSANRLRCLISAQWELCTWYFIPHERFWVKYILGTWSWWDFYGILRDKYSKTKFMIFVVVSLL